MNGLFSNDGRFDWRFLLVGLALSLGSVAVGYWAYVHDDEVTAMGLVLYLLTGLIFVRIATSSEAST